MQESVPLAGLFFLSLWKQKGQKTAVMVIHPRRALHHQPELHPHHARRFLLPFTMANCMPAPSQAIVQPTAAPKHTAAFLAALPSDFI